MKFHGAFINFFSKVLFLKIRGYFLAFSSVWITWCFVSPASLCQVGRKSSAKYPSALLAGGLTQFPGKRRVFVIPHTAHLTQSEHFVTVFCPKFFSCSFNIWWHRPVFQAVDIQDTVRNLTPKTTQELFLIICRRPATWFDLIRRPSFNTTQATEISNRVFVHVQSDSLC